ncbi:hypothetical protein F4805DRAFT_463879 [Annulohypoxylon moriforme]|nr:hypothetical protein F4805DRAFT_463879 [Annulohypoxylon moriforme]
MDSHGLPTPIALPTGGRAKGLLRRINVYHPGYPDLDPLINLQATDDGIFYPLLYYTCCVIAYNVWTENKRQNRKDEPFLSEFLDVDKTPATIPDDILRGKKYYFHVPGWPNVSIPSTRALSIGPFPSLCRGRLRRSVSPVPTSQMSPKQPNLLSHLISSRPSLRKDIRWFFDHSNLIFFPRKNPDSPNSTQLPFRSQTLLVPGKSNNGNLELIARYHNKPLFSLQGLSREYFFARFAN